jgi:hypothetical protein
MDEYLMAALKAEKLKNYAHLFVKNNITDDLIDSLTDQDLQNLGIGKLGERRRLLRSFKAESRGLTVCAALQGGTLPGDSELAGQQVEPFLIGKHPVRQKEWDAVRIWALANGYQIADGKAESWRHPITHVNWYDAVKWCNAKSEWASLDPPYLHEGRTYRKGDFGPDGSTAIVWDRTSTGFRLPTEAEWEWTAREGSMWPTCDPFLSDELEKEPDSLGIFDLSGDYFDWCWDSEQGQSMCRIRGGSWKHHVGRGAFGHRSAIPPDKRDGVTGLRLARTVANAAGPN